MFINILLFLTVSFISPKQSRKRGTKDKAQASGGLEEKRRKTNVSGRSSDKMPSSRRRLETDHPLPCYEDMLSSPPPRGLPSVVSAGKPETQKMTGKEISAAFVYNGCDPEDPRFDEMLRQVRTGKLSVANAIKRLVDE